MQPALSMEHIYEGDHQRNISGFSGVYFIDRSYTMPPRVVLIMQRKPSAKVSNGCD